MSGERELLRYNSPWGPRVRIAMICDAEEIRFSVIGNYRLNDRQGNEIARLPDGTEGVAVVKGSRPAQLSWHLLLGRKRSREELEPYGEKWAKHISEFERVVIGFDFKAPSGEVIKGREHCLLSPGFATREEALKRRAALPGGEELNVIMQRVEAPRGRIILRLSGGGEFELDDDLTLEPFKEGEERIVLYEVVVGVDYHWRHYERQKLRGELEIGINNEGRLEAINTLPLELYLISVNSSEMMSVMPEELLKVQTVIARNTVLATMGKHHCGEDYHLCADDHCQCYRGASRETAASRRLSLATHGQVLTYNGELCDTRYSKICGGISEEFHSVWGGEPVPYLQAREDAPAGTLSKEVIPADNEERVRKLLDSSPEVYCNTQVVELPDYLEYARPYFRWRITYSAEQLRELLSRFPHYDVGRVKDMTVVGRGRSGRIEHLRVEGEKGKVVIGREFEIRKALSSSFLYSSCFYMNKQHDTRGWLKQVELCGGGWGHGAGLCQIGATMMAYKGKDMDEILEHYYPGTQLTQLSGEKIGEEEKQHILGEREFRLGDACYEFFNCYLVAQCPVYIQRLRLEVQRVQETIEFVVAEGNQELVSSVKIECPFLGFKEGKAVPKMKVDI